MKKIISLTLVSFLLFTILSINSAAHIEQDITYLSDGSYFVTTIVEHSTSARASGTKTGQKTVDYCNSDGEVQWTATIKGTFTYTGSSATCTSASISHYIYDSTWKITAETATKSGNKATGNVTAKKYLLGIPTRTIEKSITLTCSATGTLS